MEPVTSEKLGQRVGRALKEGPQSSTSSAQMGTGCSALAASSTFSATRIFTRASRHAAGRVHMLLLTYSRAPLTYSRALLTYSRALLPHSSRRRHRSTSRIFSAECMRLWKKTSRISITAASTRRISLTTPSYHSCFKKSLFGSLVHSIRTRQNGRVSLCLRWH